MKVTVSSKALATRLSRIDFSENTVRSVSFKKDNRVEGANNSYEMKLNLKDSYQTIMVEINNTKDFKDSVVQKYNRWDLLRNLAMSINDQPISLEIKTGILNVVLNF